MKKGIAIAGNILADNVKMVAEYPKKGMLATITEEEKAVGGCVCNTGIDLKRLNPDLEVKAYGRIGDDDNGKYVLSVMQREGMNCENVKVSSNLLTSYSDVITVMGTGERTFFHNRGANKAFCEDDVDVESLDCDLFHIGYLMLLDYFDTVLEDGSTPMARLLKRVREKGIKTSIDVVSESSGRFNQVVSSALKYCDYVIVNEIEAGAIAGVEVRDNSENLNEDGIFKAMQTLLDMGVKEKVVVHCPEKAFCLTKDGKFTTVNSIKLKKGFIKGSVGAGDAFCAGCLYSIYSGYSDDKMLELANLVAVNCLSEKDSISGVRKIEDLKKVLEN